MNYWNLCWLGNCLHLCNNRLLLNNWFCLHHHWFDFSNNWLSLLNRLGGLCLNWLNRLEHFLDDVYHNLLWNINGDLLWLWLFLLSRLRFRLLLFWLLFGQRFLLNFNRLVYYADLYYFLLDLFQLHLLLRWLDWLSESDVYLWFYHGGDLDRDLGLLERQLRLWDLDIVVWAQPCVRDFLYYGNYCTN